MNIKWEDYKELKFLKGKLNKRYTKPIFLGEGKFGKVFKLEDLKLKRACALKVLSLAGLDKLNEDQKKDTLKQFRVEAEKYANCDHPNIVKIYDISEGVPFSWCKRLFYEQVYHANGVLSTWA